MTPGALLLATTITLWHAMGGAEREALERTIARVNQDAARAGSRFEVQPLFVPFEALAEKLRTTIPQGHGPDLFVYAHDKLGSWAEQGLVAPLEPPAGTAATLRAGVTIGDRAYGIPVAYKALLLYYDRLHLPDGPPARVEDVKAIAYPTADFFFHAPFFLAAGGRLFEGDRVAAFDDGGHLERVLAWKRAGALPDEPTTALVAELFNAGTGKAALVLSGPWFAGDIALPRDRWGVAPLWPGHGSFVSVEAIFLSSRAREPALAAEAARALAAHWRRAPGLEAIEAAQEPAMRAGVVTPARPEMALVWAPMNDLLDDVLEGGAPVEVALARARRAFEESARPDPPAADPSAYIAIASAAMLILVAWLCVRAVRDGAFARARRPEARFAYALSLPGLLAMAAFVVVPMAWGIAAAFQAFPSGGEARFVGLQNFATVLSSGRFYVTLAVTVLWTVANVALHVAIGVALALLLRRPWLRLRGLYRILLVLPWAVPSYITALTWKGMFNRQLGAINAILGGLGIEPVSWFSSFSTAFAANLVTNTWLGFPFMMVVTLGALQGIPAELEEVAALEGASRAQRFRWVVLPAIGPALAPAVILGSVWTFNMINVIYLVSGGKPQGTTEILISEAYKWAFARQHRYGYAAAYAVLIFLLLLVYSRLILRPARAEGARA